MMRRTVTCHDLRSMQIYTNCTRAAGLCSSFKQSAGADSADELSGSPQGQKLAERSQRVLDINPMNSNSVECAIEIYLFPSQSSGNPTEHEVMLL